MASAATIGIAGTVGLALWGKGAWALAYGIGAAISVGNFWLIAAATARLGQSEKARAAGHLWKGAVFRFALAGVILVMALAVFRVHLLGLVAGLLITQAWMVCHWLIRMLQTEQ